MRRKSFRPVVDVMESRVALSSSTSPFTSFFDNLLGIVNTGNSNNTHHYTAAQVAHIKAKRAAEKVARQEHLAALNAAHSHH
jgi:hypothetical protein